MPKYTENLNLFKYDVPNDGNRPFDIETSLNENWDKIDTFSQENNLQNKITNCITEIPQRIKLELNNGVLTLKAGSVVTIPNGFELDGTTRHFDYVEITEDLTTLKIGSETMERMLFVSPISTVSGLPTVRNFYSPTKPNVTTPYAYWYDSVNNILKYTSDKGNTWIDGCSLPIGLATFVDGIPTSLNQVFNGIGFFDSIVWIDKDIKCLIPAGKSENGTLRNIEYTTTKCTTAEIAINSSECLPIFVSPSRDGITIRMGRYYIVNKLPQSIETYAVCYNYTDNYMYRTTTGGSTWVKEPYAKIGQYTNNNGPVLGVNSLRGVNLLKTNDFPELSGIGMPSNEYKSLSFGSTGTTYRAPANGWFSVIAHSSSGNSNGTLDITNETIGFSTIVTEFSSSVQTLAAFLPCRKGDTIKINYSNLTFTQSNDRLRFYYAEGEV